MEPGTERVEELTAARRARIAAADTADAAGAPAAAEYPGQ